MKAISLKLQERQLKLLEQTSRATHISQSSLMRQGIDLILLRFKEDVLSPEFRREVDALLTQDRELLTRLAKA